MLSTHIFDNQNLILYFREIKHISNIVTKNIKTKYNNGNGEIIKTEAPIHRSNVKVIEVAKEKKKATKEKAEKKDKKQTKEDK